MEKKKNKKQNNVTQSLLKGQQATNSKDTDMRGVFSIALYFQPTDMFAC